MAPQPVTAIISGGLEAKSDDILRFFQTFSLTLSGQTLPKVNKITAPSRLTVQPLAVQVVDLCDITNAKVIFIKSTKPIHVTMTFAPTAPTPPPTPATATIFVKDFLFMTTEISDLTITNPNSGIVDVDVAEVDILLVGT